jgi:hypothetical protein
MTCQERSGFLFAHACDRPPAGACSRCTKAICLEHTRLAGGLPCCIGCAKEAETADGQERSEHEDDPYWYSGDSSSGYTTYDADDFKAFDHTEEPAGDDQFETDAAGS